MRRVSAGGWALPGERTLWTGQPVHTRIRRADAGLTLYLAAVVVVLAVASTRWLPGISLPGYFKVLIVTVWGLGALHSLGMLVSLLVTALAQLRRTVYEVTNYRVIVSCGPGADDGTSVYLDQLDKRMVRPGSGRSGTCCCVRTAAARITGSGCGRSSGRAASGWLR